MISKQLISVIFVIVSYFIDNKYVISGFVYPFTNASTWSLLYIFVIVALFAVMLFVLIDVALIAPVVISNYAFSNGYNYVQ